MSSFIRRTLGLIAAMLLAASVALAQQAVVTRNVYLRQQPSSASPALDKLLPEDEVELLSPDKTNDYYHVRTEEDDKEGWVWSRNVRIRPEPGSGLAMFTAGTTPTTSISADWAKPGPVVGNFTSGGKVCGPEGKGGDSPTNRLKNRTDIPASFHSVTFDAIASLPTPDGLPRRRLKWSPEQLAEIRRHEGVAVRLVGYLVVIREQTKGSGEATNCKWKKSREVDWHLALVEHPGQGEREAIVIETTPRIRRFHPKWTPQRLEPWVGSDLPVRITAWLMMDPQHREHLGTYRQTLWELHPITQIEVWKADENRWVDLDALP